MVRHLTSKLDLPRDELVTGLDHAFPINEASLSRLLRQIESKDFAILTAYHREYTKAENVISNRSLRAEINGLGFAPYALVGHWQEAPAGMDYLDAKSQGLLRDTIERSYLVVRRQGMSQEDFTRSMFDLAGKWQQYGLVLVAQPHHCGAYAPDGTELTHFGSDKITLIQIVQAYSQFAKKVNVPFLFEGIETPNATSLALAGIRRSGWNW